MQPLLELCSERLGLEIDDDLLRRLLSQEERSGRPMKDLVNLADETLVYVAGCNSDAAELCSHDAVLRYASSHVHDFEVATLKT